MITSHLWVRIEYWELADGCLLLDFWNYGFLGLGFVPLFIQLGGWRIRLGMELEGQICGHNKNFDIAP